MGRIFLIELDGRTYRCRFCDSALALADDVISRKLCEARMHACKRTRLRVVGVGKKTEEPINRTKPIKGTATAAESRSRSVAFAFERCQWCRPQCMTLHAPTELINRVWNCKSLKTRGQLGGENHLVPWVNITLGPEEDRLMYSGLHTVEDIFCCCCGQILGWKYVIAHEKNQKYKEGKFVLERWRIVEDVAEEFNLDARLGSSDGENP